MPDWIVEAETEEDMLKASGDSELREMTCSPPRPPPPPRGQTDGWMQQQAFLA